MGGQLSLTVVEIIVLMMGAVILGVTIHFLITSNKTYKRIVDEAPGGKISQELTSWKMKYFNDTEKKDKEIGELRKRLSDAEENTDIYTIEADEMRQQNKKLTAEIEKLRHQVQGEAKGTYIEQLRFAQQNLKEHQEKTNRLMEQIVAAETAEKKQEELYKLNQDLTDKVNELKTKLDAKEKESVHSQKKEHLTTEMNSLLDSTYTQFNVLQNKIQKLESQLSASKRDSMEVEELKENYDKTSNDLKELKLKYEAISSENSEMEANLAETQHKLKEANFERQQLQKKVAFLEEMNSDMEVVTDANKKLEGQIKRIGELESMLNIVASERDELAKKQTNA
jgi:chromosome segregation ATPase